MNLTGSESKAEILNSFVKQFYAGTPFVPHEIWVQEELEDAEVIASFLTARRGTEGALCRAKDGRERAAGRAGGEECEDGALPRIRRRSSARSSGRSGR